MAPRTGSLHSNADTARAAYPQPNIGKALAAPRIVICPLAPLVEHGRFAARAVAGQPVEVQARIFMDGHDQLAARLTVLLAGDRIESLPLRPAGNDYWLTSFTPAKPGRYHLHIEAWLDVWSSFRHALQKKHDARQPLGQDIADGRALIEAALGRASGSDRQSLAALEAGTRDGDESVVAALLLSETTAAVMARVCDHPFETRAEPELMLEVERKAAGFAAWYELFPRSLGAVPGQHGTLDDVIGRLPAIRAMGFDVLYLTPVHPIGRTHRKGPNNSLRALAGDPGSPYAIGGPEGGHEAVHPQLGGIEAFRRLRAAAADHGLELALDFAIQCSPDHPWLQQHPEWFSRRADGSIRYAENPPKKYEDIVNVDFYAAGAMPALWLALRDVVLGWVAEGVRLFRVDNPHTKPLPFWQWLIEDVRAQHPDVVFLSEAFTRPAMMYRLAQIGFSQSYTYFTWRNSKQELTDYFTELTQGPPRHFFRPHLFVNTPDINPYFLQSSGRPGFLIRAALAATLSGLWGLYSGFELCEAAALAGREEYLDSEKYQLRQRDWQAPGNIVAEISRLNHIRRENPALHSHLGLRFYNAFNDQVLYYGKATPDLANFILVAVSLDPHRPQQTTFEVPLWEFGLPDSGAVEAEELMQGTRLRWQGKLQHWYFDPQRQPFAIWRIHAQV
ncbi:MAG TPA: alpha-1,4-glucan--maltose-1-phosphate maltosyltransferase [Nevskia sp.]|nr:alpha-1,4-glucan--maltose-1-phosphate maltosyltransferase [Nevskia sp.]